MPNNDTQTPKRSRRWLVLVGIGLLLVLAAVAYRFYGLSLPLGEGPAGPTVDRAAFAEPWTDREVLLLGIGDSITAGYGVREAYSYVGRLAKNPKDEFDDMRGICLSAVLPNIEKRNIARSGSTSIHHLDYVTDQLDEQHPAVFGLVVMTSGGNDLIHNYGRTLPREGAMYGASIEQAGPWIESFEQRLGRILDLIAKRFPGGCLIFLADIYDPTDGVGDAERAGLPAWPDAMKMLDAYNAVIRRCAAERPFVHVVPIHDDFLGHGFHCTQPWNEHYRADDPHHWYAPNIEDPTACGYDAIRRRFLIEIANQADHFRELPVP